MDDLNELIDNTIALFCQDIANKPLIYFSESDLQSLLYARLYANSVLSKLYPTKYPKGFMGGNESKSMYKTLAIHREYGFGGRQRIDLAIFKTENLHRINDSNLQDENKYLTPDFGIEFGTEKCSDQSGHFKGDFKRLDELVSKRMQKGYLIHFYRNTTTAPKDTATYEDKQKKILELQDEIEAFDFQKNLKVGN